MEPLLDNESKPRIGPKVAPYFKTALQYGLILGAASAVLQLGAWLMGVDPQNPNTGLMPKLVLGLAGIILSVIIYRMVMINHRDHLQDGYLSLGQCVGIGAALGLGSGVIVGIYTMFFGTVINPNFAAEMKANMFEAWEQQGLNEDAMETAWGWTKYFVDPIVGGIAQIISGPIGGLIFGLIIGLFVKREAPMYMR